MRTIQQKYLLEVSREELENIYRTLRDFLDIKKEELNKEDPYPLHNFRSGYEQTIEVFRQVCIALDKNDNFIEFMNCAESYLLQEEIA